jgi:mannitol-specific phosphotransferase system IIBC component
MASNSPAAPSSDGIVSNVQNFVAEHKKLVIGVTAAAVATTLAVVLYKHSALPADDLEKRDEKKSSKKKKGQSSKTKKNGTLSQPFDPNGPIIEEVQKEDIPTCTRLVYS